MQGLVKFIGKFTKASVRTEEYLDYRVLVQRSEHVRRRALLNRRADG